MTQAGPRSGRLELELLRSSVENRCRLSRMPFPAMVVNSALVLPLLGRGLPPALLFLWLAGVTGLLFVRLLVARRAQRELAGTRASLSAYDLRFRLTSMATQVVTGAGVWMAWGSDDATGAYIITLLIAFYGVGAMANLAHDFRSAKWSLPLLMGQPIVYWVLHPPDGLFIAAILGSLLLMMLLSARGSQRTFEESVSVRYEKDGLLDQLQVEKGLTEAALDKARDANRAKSFFMAAASHDLRQPLYAASILRDALAMHPLTPQVEKLVQQQGQALSAASSLFDNLLDLSKFESGGVHPELRPVDLTRLFEQIAVEAAPQCELKGLEFRTDIDSGWINTDPDLLLRMVRNLVGNAIRYTDAGHVTVSARRADGRVCIRIEDSGPGISPENQERIFQEFFQIQNPERSRDRGVGLGLAIVRHIARLLGAELTLDSALGRGTTLVFWQPLVAGPEAVSVVPAGPRASADVWRGQSVWVVDDDSLVRDALLSYFQHAGSQVRVFASAAAVRQALVHEQAPDWIVIDDMLGAEESGLDLARHVSGYVDDRRVMIATGNALQERLQVLAESGFTVERKPVSAERFLQWRNRAIGSEAAPR